MKTTYEQLFELVGPLVKNYREDLTKYDRECIEKNPGMEFVHWTRENGTHLAFLTPADHDSWPAEGVKVPYLFGQCDRRELAQKPVDVADYMTKNNEILATHWFDGNQIHRITVAKALEITKRHRDSLIDGWAAEYHAKRHKWDRDMNAWRGILVKEQSVKREAACV